MLDVGDRVAAVQSLVMQVRDAGASRADDMAALQSNVAGLEAMLRGVARQLETAPRAAPAAAAPAPDAALMRSLLQALQVR